MKQYEQEMFQDADNQLIASIIGGFSPWFSEVDPPGERAEHVHLPLEWEIHSCSDCLSFSLWVGVYLW